MIPDYALCPGCFATLTRYTGDFYHHMKEYTSSCYKCEELGVCCVSAADAHPFRRQEQEDLPLALLELKEKP